MLLFCWQAWNQIFDLCCLLKRPVPLHNGVFRANIALCYSSLLHIHGSSHFCWQGNYLLQSLAVLCFKYWSLFFIFDCLLWRQCMPCHMKMSIQIYVLFLQIYWYLSSCRCNIYFCEALYVLIRCQSTFFLVGTLTWLFQNTVNLSYHVMKGTEDFVLL